MQAGSLVAIAAPFNKEFPGQYPVIHLFGDGSAAVMVPGWVQQGATFDPAAEGANFAGSFLIDSGHTVDLATLQIPTSTPLPAPSVAAFQIASASTPAINGSYAIDQTSQQNVAAVSIYCAINGKFPAGQAALAWPDASGAMHLFPSVAVWNSFASAMADFVMHQALGQAPTQPSPVL